MIRVRLNILIRLGFWMVFAHSGFSQVNPSAIDSTFWFLSLPELQSHRAYYIQELRALQEEKQNLIKRGIEDGERLLEMKPDLEYIDEILIRLADLYYYKEKDDYLQRMEWFQQKLERGELDDLPEEPRLDCSQSLEIYQRIIDEFPQSKLVDDAFYNKGFLLEEIGKNKEAHQVYMHLIEAYSESKYVPEAYMRMGEYYFNPPINDLDRAIQYYEHVLKFRDNPRYDEALYKVGWSYYRLSRYPEAISYFTTLVEGLYAVEEYDPNRMMVRADLRDEAIEYIAISFIDFGGPVKAREFMGGIGDPPWGWDVLNKLGDVYKDEKEDYGNAILAYETMLRYDRSSPAAPFVQKKIVDCYQILKDNEQTFAVRQRLFEMYKSDGIWWKETTDEKAKLDAYKLAEQSLRENINTVMREAETSESKVSYEKAVELGRLYLDSFPEDLHAYMIRWNIALILDTKLRQYNEALQEYLTICMVYTSKEYETFARNKGLATIKDAAENAVVVADSMVQGERRQSEGLTRPESANGEREAVPLTAAERWLAMAYDNYIKLFPFDKNTPTILANAGVLYYAHNQFTEAVRYYKTLMKYFPHSDQVQSAQYSVLESYFGKKDYDSAEILAKKIVSESESGELKTNAQKRLGEAIFLKAEKKALSGNASAAADEYYRMALEAPDLEFADRALFNAGREYERIGDYASAIRAYEMLRVSYSGSSLLLDALNNLAFDYGEMGEYQKGAERYQTLANLQTDDEKARDALYNAFVFYGNARNWPKSVEVGERYVSRYPDAEDAKAVYLKTGEYFQRLDNISGARRVYSSFARRYPDSPLSVEAYFRLGQFYHQKDSLNQSERFFHRAYTTNEGLKARGLEPNDYYASEGLYLASRLLHERYRQIAFFLPQATLDRQIEEKQTLLRQLERQYTQVATFRTQRLPETVYRIGEAYEQFAQAWVDQEIPSMDPTSRAIREKEINERTAEIYNQALKSYERAVLVLERLANHNVSGEEKTGSFSSSVDDSVLTMTRSWLGKSKEKISETLYQMAEVNTESIERLLSAPVPADLKGVARLDYRSQVLVKAIKPLLDVVVGAHRRNLHVADSLGLQNQWTEASRSKLLSSVGLLGQKYYALTLDAMSEYIRTVRQYDKTVLQDGQSAPEEVVNTMANLIELSKSYAQVAVLFYKQGVDVAVKSGIVFSDIIQVQDEMVQLVLQMADYYERLIARGLDNQRQAERLFLAQGELFYEEALAVFEDNEYFLKDGLKTLLEEAYTAEKSFRIPSPSGGWIAVRLVKMDPDTYSEQMNIPVVSMTIQTDTTWWFSPMHQEGWENPDYRMIGWFHPRKTAGGSVSWNLRSSYRPRNNSVFEAVDTVYVRKEIIVLGYPISGEIQLKGHEPHQIYWNGKKIKEEAHGSNLSVTPILQQGKNVVAFECSSQANPPAEVITKIRYIPQRVLPLGRTSD